MIGDLKDVMLQYGPEWGTVVLTIVVFSALYWRNSKALMRLALGFVAQNEILRTLPEQVGLAVERAQNGGWDTEEMEEMRRRQKDAHKEADKFRQLNGY